MIVIDHPHLVCEMTNHQVGLRQQLRRIPRLTPFYHRGIEAMAELASLYLGPFYKN